MWIYIERLSIMEETWFPLMCRQRMFEWKVYSFYFQKIKNFVFLKAASCIYYQQTV